MRNLAHDADSNQTPRWSAAKQPSSWKQARACVNLLTSQPYQYRHRPRYQADLRKNPQNRRRPYGRTPRPRPTDYLPKALQAATARDAGLSTVTRITGPHDVRLAASKSLGHGPVPRRTNVRSGSRISVPTPISVRTTGTVRHSSTSSRFMCFLGRRARQLLYLIDASTICNGTTRGETESG